MPDVKDRSRILARVAPGLVKLLGYQKADFSHDVVAGLSVAAVALPVGVAYAELAGFPPVVGLYSSILPLVAYAVFGTSRQLIIGPDAATCALVSAAVAPMASGNPLLFQSLSMTLAFLAGLLCIVGSFLKLGALADYLSKPILVGFLNGIALSIVLGQAGKILGFPVNAGRIVPRVLEIAGKLGQTHGATLAVGAGSFLILILAPRLLKRMPAALLAMIAAGIVVRALNLEAHGVKIVGQVPSGFPAIHIPQVPLDTIPNLLGDAAGLALVTFSSMMLTARSFAAKNRYDIDVDQEFAALGASNIASAFSGGFAVSGADSRTAMNDTSGGRTQAAGLIAALTIACVLMFFTGPLRYVPVAALGAVMVKAAFSLVDLAALRLIYKIDRREFALSLLSTLGVVAFGAIQAILVTVVLSLLRFVKLVSRPKIEILGTVEGFPGFHSIERHADARPVPGMTILRFNAPIVFFNAPYFKREILAALKAGGSDLKWLVLDMVPITMIDATGLYTAQELAGTLEERGVTLAAAGRQTEWSRWAEANGLKPKVRMFPTLRRAISTFREEVQSGDVNALESGSEPPESE